MKRRTMIQLLGLLFFLLLCSIGVLVYSTCLVAGSLLTMMASTLFEGTAIGAEVVGFLISILDGIAQCVQNLLVLEILTAIITLTTQGPLVAAVWVWSRVGVWMGQ